MKDSEFELAQPLIKAALALEEAGGSITELREFLKAVREYRNKLWEFKERAKHES